MLRRTLIVTVSLAVGLLSACAPEWGGGSSPTTTLVPPSTGQTTHFTYAGPKGSCDQEIVLVGARIRPCQGLGNTTTSVIVNSKVLDPWCTDFFAYYPVTKVTGAAQQGNATRQLVQTDTTPGTPAFDTGFDVANGPIIVTITELSVDTADGLECGWFG